MPLKIDTPQARPEDALLIPVCCLGCLASGQSARVIISESICASNCEIYSVVNMAEDATTQEQSETPVTHAIPVDQPPQVQEQQQSEPLPVQPSVDSPVPPLTNIHADIDMADFGVGVQNL